MLEHFVDITLAREQTGLFFAGLALILLSGAVLTDYLLVLKNSVRLPAKLIGVREKPGVSNSGNPLYFPVVEYITPNGKKVTAETDGGSSSLTDKILGSNVTILAKPDQPNEVRITGIVRPVFSLIFLVTGFLLAAIAISQYSVTFWTMLTATIVVAVALPWIFRRLTQKDSGHPLSAKSYQQRVKEKKSLNFLASDEFLVRIRKMQQQARYMNPVMILISLMLLAGGYYWGQDITGQLLNGNTAEGEIVGQESEYLTAESSYYYYPVVEFMLPEGRKVRFRDRTGSSSPVQTAGEQVTVIYDPADPEKAMINRGLWNLLPPAGVFLAGFIFLLVGIKSLFTYASLGKKLQAVRSY